MASQTKGGSPKLGAHNAHVSSQWRHNAVTRTVARRHGWPSSHPGR